MKNRLLITMLLFCATLYAQISNAEPLTPVPTLMLSLNESPISSKVTSGELLWLNVQMGKKEKGGTLKQFQLKQGETVFIPINGGLSNQPAPQQLENIGYKNALGEISEKIARKISEIEKKQKEIDAELYPAYQAPLNIEKQRLAAELLELQERKTKLVAEETVKEVVKEQNDLNLAHSAPQALVAGLYVKPSVSGNIVNVELRSQGLKTKTSSEIQGTLETPFGQWLQVPNQEVWIKVEKTQ
jgi:hypothetical protein